MSVTFTDNEFSDFMAAVDAAIVYAGNVAAMARRVAIMGYQSATRDEMARALAGIPSAPAPGPGPAADDVDDAADAAELPPLKLTAAPGWAAANELRNQLMGQAMKFGQCGRAPSAGTRQLVFLTLRQAALFDDAALHAFINFVFGAVSYKDLTSGAVWALHYWLKPTGIQNGEYAAANAAAPRLVATVVAAHAIEENPPALDPVPAHA